ncbi:unnamed protein product [Calypogeia fissa]
MSCLKWQGRVHNRQLADIIWKAILKACSIPNSDVKFDELSKVALVRSQSNREDWHVVEGYDGDSCICTCGSSVQGNTCKHQIKLLTIGGMKETSILQQYGTLYGNMVRGMAFEKAKWPEVPLH